MTSVTLSALLHIGHFFRVKRLTHVLQHICPHLNVTADWDTTSRHTLQLKRSSWVRSSSIARWSSVISICMMLGWIISSYSTGGWIISNSSRDGLVTSGCVIPADCPYSTLSIISWFISACSSSWEVSFCLGITFSSEVNACGRCSLSINWTGNR